MIDERQVFEKSFRRYEPEGGSFERLLRRRDRKRRNQRIAAGVVGIAVFVAAIWIVTSVSSLDRSETSVVPGGDVTGPAETGPTLPPASEGWAPHHSTLPQESGVPSIPETGKVVAYFSAMHVGFVYVYADGRVISYPDGGFVREQRLTPDGVDLVRSGAVYPSAFLFPFLRPEELPASAWADPEIRPHVPARYAICYTGKHDQVLDPSEVVHLLPAQAEALLRGKQRIYNHTAGLDDGGNPISPDQRVPPRTCSELTIEEARALDGILSESWPAVDDVGYEFEAPDPIGTVGIWFGPLLPNGVGVAWGG